MAHETALARPAATSTGWPVRLALSVALGGFLMLMGVISFPLPWTPVPFSMIPFGLLVAGAYQRPGWAVLSVVLYLAAGAMGAPVYAEGSSGVHHLVGRTAGYLFGFVALSALVSWYVQERRRLLPPRWVAITGGLVGALVLGGIVALVRFKGSGGLSGYGYAGFGITRSVLWVLLFLLVVATTATVWSLQRSRGQSLQALNLFLVMLAGIGLLHLLGVTGLVLIGGFDVVTSIIVGSVVFLPFDIIKAGLAVGLSLPFLEAPHKESP